MTPSLTADRVVSLGERPDETTHFIAELRDRMGEGTCLRWRGTIWPSFTTEVLWHLPHPVPVAPDEQIAVWKSRFQPGLCYFRRGPKFVSVRDIRDPEAAASYVIDDEDLLRAFDQCLQPKQLGDLARREREAVEVLIDEALVLRVGDHVVTLPYRMRRWPVPASEV